MIPCDSCIDYDNWHDGCKWCKEHEYGLYRAKEAALLPTPVITNYDRLISKTPEELADYLYNHDFCIDSVRSIGNSPCDWDCRKCISEWIKSPVEENPDPAYCVVCPSCMSVVKYQKSEAQSNYISCHFCGFSIKCKQDNKTAEGGER